MSIAVGTILEGKVTGITNFGAFIELPGGATGLVHISEVADVYVKDVKDFLKDQDKVKVKIINIDPKGKIGLSIKQANPKATENTNPSTSFRPQHKPRERNHHKSTITFEDKLSKFLKESDEKLADFKRSTDSKRGGRGSSRY